MEIKEKLNAARSALSARAVDTRETLRGLPPRLDRAMRASPASAAAIALGAGFGLGLLGRFLRARSRHRRGPSIIIVEASC